MKKYLLSFLMAAVMMISSNTFAADNVLSVVPYMKTLDQAAIGNVQFQYQRKLIPTLSGFIRISPSVDFEYEGQSFQYDNLTFGVRQDLLFFYVGIAYDTLSGSYSDGSNSADITVSGLLFEIGQNLDIGPIRFGAGLGAQMANVDINYSSSEFDIDLITSDSLWLIEFYAEAGYKF